MGVIAIVGYRPKKGKEDHLKELMKTHVPILREQGLATNRASIVASAGDGTIVEVFEWNSKEAIESAHTNPAVLEMWSEYSEVCDYTPVAELPESADMFMELQALN